MSGQYAYRLAFDAAHQITYRAELLYAHLVHLKSEGLTAYRQWRVVGIQRAAWF